MIFCELPSAEPDPILSLASNFERDGDPRKIDLGIGVYKNEEGICSIPLSVKRAEAWLLECQATKSYLSSVGEPAFNAAVQTLLFGQHSGAVRDGRVRTIQTPGASGALRVAAELIVTCRPQATVWIPTPTWANHGPIMRTAGLAVREYPYYDRANSRLTFDAMIAALGGSSVDDIVLVHGCCHNPSGADLSLEQWRELSRLLLARGAAPFVDIAYQGFAQGIEEDASGLRLLAGVMPELFVASSSSKSFSLYRERTGSVSLLARNATEADKAQGRLLGIARTMYSMPPDHGAAVVARILHVPELRRQWVQELSDMRGRLGMIRSRFAELLTDATGDDFTWIQRQNGMLSLLDLSPAQVLRLRDEYHVHAVGSGRINIAGLSNANVSYAAEAVAAVLRQ